MRSRHLWLAATLGVFVLASISGLQGSNGGIPVFADTADVNGARDLLTAGALDGNASLQGNGADVAPPYPKEYCWRPGFIGPVQAQPEYPPTPFLYQPFRATISDWSGNGWSSQMDHQSPNYQIDGVVATLGELDLLDDRNSPTPLLQGTLAWPRTGGSAVHFPYTTTATYLKSNSYIPYYFSHALELFFGYDGHDGHDFAVGGDALAAAAGTVSYVGPRLGGYGTVVEIYLPAGYKLRYAHLDATTVKAGDSVVAGQTIGTIGGSSGASWRWPIHLHFSVFHWNATRAAWQITDPFGWDPWLTPGQQTQDPLQHCNGEVSYNLWFGWWPQPVSGNATTASRPLNDHYAGGWIDDGGTQPPSNDTTAPSGSFSSPAPGQVIASSVVAIGATASDNAGGSGVREVRFSAKWNNTWQGIGVAYAAPYTLAWDLCAAGVPDGDVELGLEVWDNASNKWVYSEHASNPHFTKQFNCVNSPVSANWDIDFWTNTFLAGYVNAHTTDSSVYLFKEWQGGSPFAGIGATDWSARFTVTRYFQGGHYDFYGDADDSVRIRVDGEAGDPNWWGNTVRGYDLPAGNHTVVVEYRQIGGGSKLQFFWRGPGAMPVTPQDTSQWYAQYYPNRDLWGEPPLQLNEGGGFLHKQWDGSGPGWGLPTDSFSTRFRRTVDFACGLYQFNLFTDDGARVRLDGSLVPGLDQWHDGVNGYSVSVPIAAGAHEISVEHYENNGSAAVQLDWSLVSTCLPDLSPLPVIASSVQATAASGSLHADARTFFDWHFTNSGGLVTSPFFVELWVDGQLMARYPYPAMGAPQTGGFDDWAETVPQSGSHTVKLIVDPDNQVSESDETNNIWSGQYVWSPFLGWKGEYYRNTTLDGNPWLTRDDPVLDFDWFGNAPDPALTGDQFSVRWTKDQSFSAGLYQFDVFHDDGVRFYVDGRLVHDNWCGDCRTTESVAVILSGGVHHLEVDYWQNAGWSAARLAWTLLQSLDHGLYLPDVRLNR